MDPFAKPTPLLWWQTALRNTKKHRSQILKTVRILPFAKHIKRSEVEERRVPRTCSGSGTSPARGSEVQPVCIKIAEMVCLS